jgi:NAD(P)-dependent dehydrogenase (short-subunit alcohol dehydrogenase family)
MLHALFELTDRVAVVSGAASGMGRAMSLAFAEAGAHLMLVDRNLEGAEQTAAVIEKLGRRAQAIRCDVSDPEQIRNLFSLVDRTFGRIDVLGNVAGDGILGPAEELTLEQVQQVLQNLVVGRFCCCQEGGRRMLAAGKGSIINIGSLASSTALGRGHTAYSMAMGAVAQMTRELSTEWSGRGVRVNAILPAQVVNPGLTRRMQADPNLEATFLRGIPIGRLGRPDDIKGLAIFLASDASAWITGALIPMDGGNLAMNAGGSVPTRRYEPIVESGYARA